MAEFKEGSKVLGLTNEARLKEDNNKAPGTRAALPMHHMLLDAYRAPPTRFGTMNCLVTSRWEDKMPRHALYISLLQPQTVLLVSAPCIVQMRDREKLGLKPQIITYGVLSHSGMK